MADPFAGVAEALESARAAWASAAVPGAGVDGLSGASLVALNSAVVGVRRQVDAVLAEVAAQIARASRPELGSAGLARQQGFRTPAALISAATGGSKVEAFRFVAVGEATAPRATLTGEKLPPKYPAVAVALEAGRLGVEGAAAIVAELDKAALRVGRERLAEVEVTLVEQSLGLPLDQLQRILQRAEAWLDPEGVEPREDELRSRAFLRIQEKPNGRLSLTGEFDPERAAPVKTAIEAIVGTFLRHRDERPANAASTPGDDDRRTIPELQAEALAMICRHALGCESADVPTGGATVVVRIGLEQLESGEGFATVDGMAAPVSVSTARRMAADGAILPLVLGGDSEFLDFGRRRRLFSPAQKLVLIERDGGCACCGLPAGMAQVHHLRWWERDSGPTDLDNGVLLCVRCHHRIHDDGWTIRIDGVGARARVWFIPPPHVDPLRTPRLGGRARFDFAAA